MSWVNDVVPPLDECLPLPLYRSTAGGADTVAFDAVVAMMSNIE